MPTRTTTPGVVNENEQRVLADTHLPGNHPNQKAYAIECLRMVNGIVCGHVYGSNGADIWERRCPACQGGADGPDIRLP